MKITAVETVPYALPFSEPYVTARGTLTRREMILVRARTDEGLEGLGEAVPLTLRGGAGLDRVHRQLRRVARRLVGTELDEVSEHPLAAAVDVVVAQLAGRRLAAPAAAAVEIGRVRPRREDHGPAAVAALGRRAGRAGAMQRDPGRRRAPRPSRAPRGRGPTRGFGTFKLKLGVGDDLRQVAAVRDALGPDAADPGRRQRQLERRRGARRAARDRAARHRAGRAADGVAARHGHGRRGDCDPDRRRRERQLLEGGGEGEARRAPATWRR